MLNAKKRFKVLERDGFRCQYCGKNGKDVSLEVDHIIPKSKGGTDEFDNLITCCRECNIGKGNSIVGVDVDIWKFKVAEHETKTVKKFFEERNKNGYGTIDKNNLTFISGFIKQLYGDYFIGYIKSEVIGKMKKRNGNKITMKEFYEGGEVCEFVICEFDKFIWRNELEDILDWVGNDDERNTEDNNKRLNRVISQRIIWLEFPISFDYKYSLFPNFIKQWQTEMKEQTEWLRTH